VSKIMSVCLSAARGGCKNSHHEFRRNDGQSIHARLGEAAPANVLRPPNGRVHTAAPSGVHAAVPCGSRGGADDVPHQADSLDRELHPSIRCLHGVPDREHRSQLGPRFRGSAAVLRHRRGRQRLQVLCPAHPGRPDLRFGGLRRHHERVGLRGGGQGGQPGGRARVPDLQHSSNPVVHHPPLGLLLVLLWLVRLLLRKLEHRDVLLQLRRGHVRRRVPLLPSGVSQLTAITATICTGSGATPTPACIASATTSPSVRCSAHDHRPELRVGRLLGHHERVELRVGDQAGQPRGGVRIPTLWQRRPRVDYQSPHRLLHRQLLRRSVWEWLLWREFKHRNVLLELRRERVGRQIHLLHQALPIAAGAASAAVATAVPSVATAASTPVATATSAATPTVPAATHAAAATAVPTLDATTAAATAATAASVLHPADGE